ncbi:MAG: tRNA (adenosine(37)-N6)-threonylcarbamoyltransferase complex ATPase subunit type 1 TsaE [Proteobacteria bacterium]|nr:tRNA (adenosine(37)-N6)-threonylcarbamoyltransferase complex ATPase subunit type 1 TsaE [Pseudomonadota bacterium]
MAELISSEQAMEKLGALMYDACADKGTVVYLSGDLGAGKTTFVRGFLRKMGYQGKVKSPTYTLVEPYELGVFTLYHFDFYRLNSAFELEYMGIRDYFHDNAFCLVEWPEKAQDLLPSCDIKVHIAIQDDARQVKIEANTQRGKDVLQRFKAA